MSKAQNKTIVTEVDPRAFLATIEPAAKRQDAEALLALFQETTGLAPRMWGPAIIGFGRYRYRYESGREGECLATGFSPRKQNLTLYVMPGCEFEAMADKLARLGKHKLGKGCLYINKLADVDTSVLREIVDLGITQLRETHEVLPE